MKEIFDGIFFYLHSVLFESDSFHSNGFLHTNRIHKLCISFCFVSPFFVVGDFFPEDANVVEIQRARFKNLGQFESMYIMADLKKEILLFSIKYRSSDGLLLIYPDLNNIDINPYLKEIVFDSRNLYQFSMENLSMDCQNEVIQLKNDIELLANKVSSIMYNIYQCRGRKRFRMNIYAKWKIENN